MKNTKTFLSQPEEHTNGTIHALNEISNYENHDVLDKNSVKSSDKKMQNKFKQIGNS